MTSPTPETELPPGDTGLPYLGELPRMLRDSFAFIEERAQKHGPVFRTRLAGRNTAIITGPDAAALFIDENRVSRTGAMLPHIQALFGGLSLPVMDGMPHRARKDVVMAAFTSDALTAYLPVMQQLVDDCLRTVATAPEVRMVPVLERLGMDVLCQAVLGLTPGPELDQLLADYATIMRGLVSLPLPFPGTAFARARRALKRVLGVHRGNIDRHAAALAPSASTGRAADADGVTRMLISRASVRAATDQDVSLDALAVEHHHLLVAGMIVWSWLGAGLVALDQQPALGTRLQEEITRVVPPGL